MPTLRVNPSTQNCATFFIEANSLRWEYGEGYAVAESFTITPNHFLGRSGLEG